MGRYGQPRGHRVAAAAAAAAASAAAASVLRPPAFLDCPGPALGAGLGGARPSFPPQWDQLHRALSAARLGAPAWESRRAARGPDLPELLRWAELERQGLREGLADFHHALKGGADPGEAEEAVGGFCLYGHVAALWAVTLSPGDVPANSEPLQLALHLLGFRQSLDWLEGTRWGRLVDSTQLRQLILQGSPDACPEGPGGLPLPPPADLQRLYAAYVAPRAAPDLGTVAGGLLVALVGDHASVALDLQRTLEERVLPGAPRFEALGHYHYCNLLERCTEPLTEFLRAAAAAIDSGAECELVAPCSFLGFAESLAGVWHQAWREAQANGAGLSTQRSEDGQRQPDVVFCSHWWLLCAALREVALPVAGSTVAVHVLIERPLLFTPPAWQGEVLAAFRELALGERAGPGGGRHRDAMVAYCPLHAEFYRQQAGVAVPVAGPLSLHIRERYAPAPRRHGAARRAFVARTQYTASLQGIGFGHALRHFLAEAPAPKDGGDRWEVTVLNWGLDETKLSFEEMARFHAAVFVPAQRQQMMFMDIYCMRIPLFVPSARLFAKTFLAEVDDDAHPRWSGLGPGGPGALGETRAAAALSLGEAPAVLLDRRSGIFPTGHLYHSLSHNVGSGGEVWTHADVWCEGPERAMAWFWLSDYGNFPHVRGFDSVPGLLIALAATDETQLRAVSEAMGHFHGELLDRSGAVWSSVLAALLPRH